MGYSKNIATVLSRENLLRPLYSSRGDDEVVWHVNPKFVDSVCYQIHECFYLAKRFPKELPRLAYLAAHYTLSTTDTTVVARLRRGPIFDPSQLDGTDQAFVVPAVQSINHPIFSYAEVIQEWLNARENGKIHSLQFNRVDIPADQLPVLRRWATSMNLELDLAGQQITVSPQNDSP